MKANKRRAINGHHSAQNKTNNWFTERKVLDPLGKFDTDPATSVNRPWDTARWHYTRRDNALNLDWRGFGRVWLNPPYSLYLIEQFMARMAEHNQGTALIFARTDARWYFENVRKRASGILYIAGRLHFCRPSGKPSRLNAGCASLLVAYGPGDLDVLSAVVDQDVEYNNAGTPTWRTGRIPGGFEPLHFARGVLVASIADNADTQATWRAIISRALQDYPGPVPVAELYRRLADHPRTSANPHWRAKIRQTLQRGAGVSVGHNQWLAA